MTDGAGNYGSGESCRVIAQRQFYVYTMQYEVERSYDYLTVNGVQYKYSAPNGVEIKQGASLGWRSDGSRTDKGWKVCAEDNMSTPPPAKKSRYVAQDFGKNSCSQGTLVDTEAECKQAALALKGSSTLKYVGSWSYYPKGCLSGSDGNWEFNTHSIGSARADESPVCKVQGGISHILRK